MFKIVKEGKRSSKMPERFQIMKEFYQDFKKELNVKENNIKISFKQGDFNYKKEGYHIDISAEGFECTLYLNSYDYDSLCISYSSDNTLITDVLKYYPDNGKIRVITELDGFHEMSNVNTIKDLADAINNKINKESDMINRSQNFKSNGGILNDLSEIFGKISKSSIRYEKLTNAENKLLATILKHNGFKLIYAGGYETKNSTYGRTDRAQVIFSNGSNYLEFNSSLSGNKKVKFTDVEPVHLKTPYNNHTWDFAEYALSNESGEERRIKNALFYCGLNGEFKNL